MNRSEKIKAAGIKRHGSEEAWRNFVKEVGSKGGKSPKTKPSGFAADRGRAKMASLKGLESRWGKRD